MTENISVVRLFAAVQQGFITPEQATFILEAPQRINRLRWECATYFFLLVVTNILLFTLLRYI